MSLGMYIYKPTPYTGTDSQPDDLQFFVKGEKGKKDSFHSYVSRAPANLAGCAPIVGQVSGTVRVVNAVKAIFKELSNAETKKQEASRSACWNGFKNLFRGIAEIVPFTGVFLLIYDAVRSAVRVHSIDAKLKDKENVAVIAMDGKIVTTFKLSEFDSFFLKVRQSKEPFSFENDQQRLYAIRTLCDRFLEASAKKESPASMKTLLSKNFPQMITHR